MTNHVESLVMSAGHLDNLDGRATHFKVFSSFEWAVIFLTDLLEFVTSTGCEVAPGRDHCECFLSLCGLSSLALYSLI